MYSEIQRLMAAMSFNAYRPSEENRISLSAAGWSIVTPKILPGSDGFDATVYRSSGGQIVIAFRGTDADGAISLLADAGDDYEIGQGDRSAQVDQAIELVADVIAAFPGAEIQFTGHSLGGGLASLIWRPTRSLSPRAAATW